MSEAARRHEAPVPDGSFRLPASARDMRPPLAATSLAVPLPPIPACRAWAARYAGAHGPAIDLTQAVPGYPPHPGLLERLAAAASDRALAGYGPLEGEAPLREAVAEEMGLLYGAEVSAEDVRISAGANTGFNLAMTAMAAPGDEVILPTPWFFNHQMALALRGVRPVALPCDPAQGFLPDPERAAALLGPRSRAIVLVTPNNPTGTVMPPALVEAFAELCRRRGLWLVLDETYRDFGPDGPGDLPEAPHALFARPDWRDFVVQLYSFSKAYCIPGHRMGAVVAGPALRGEFVKAVDNIQLCPPRPPQAALAWAVPALRGWRAANRRLIAARGRMFRAALAHAPGWRVDAHGAYFAWVRVPQGRDPGAPDGTTLAEQLAAEAGLVTLPGAFFGPGGERHLRLAYANAEEAVLAGVPDRLRLLAGQA
jgi:aspartate/methionine/tyrosine aminotransferase